MPNNGPGWFRRLGSGNATPLNITVWVQTLLALCEYLWCVSQSDFGWWVSYAHQFQASLKSKWCCVTCCTSFFFPFFWVSEWSICTSRVMAADHLSNISSFSAVCYVFFLLRATAHTHSPHTQLHTATKTRYASILPLLAGSEWIFEICCGHNMIQYLYGCHLFVFVCGHWSSSYISLSATIQDDQV